MQLVRTFAALVALATVAFAVGDFASHPNAPGAVGLLVLIGVFAVLLAYLFRPAGGRVRKTPEPPREEPKPRRPARSEGVWSEGWDAGEADSARARRRRPRH